MEPDPSKRHHAAAMTLTATVTLLRLLYLAFYCPLDLAPDEAHYWDWSRHLDWCYYSKGPLVAWLIRASCEIFGTTMLAVRLPAVACGALMLVGLYLLTVQVHGSAKLGITVVALALTVPIVHVGALLMTIDAPFTCAWMWAIVFAHRAIGQGAKWCWPATGVCIMLGLLAKHTMILWVPCFALFLTTTPTLRLHLSKPGFWLMTGIGALGGVPILAWNACNGWVTFKHAQGHAGLDDDTAIHWFGPMHYVVTQFAMLLGFWFVAWARAMWMHHPGRETRPEMRFLWWMSAPTFVFFALFAWKNGGGGANWPLAGYLSGMVLVAGWLPRELGDPRTWYRRLGRASMMIAMVSGLLLTACLYQPTAVQPVLLQIGSAPQTSLHRLDPTIRLRGWRHLATEVDRVRGELRASGIEAILATERWTQTGELAFYCEGHPDVYTLGMTTGDRLSQCDLWHPNPVADPTPFRGRSFVMVNVDADKLHGAFDSLEPTRVIEYRENGRLILPWTITIGHGFRGFGRIKGAKWF